MQHLFAKRLSAIALAAALGLTGLAGGNALAQAYPPGYGHPYGPPPGYHPGWHYWHRGDYFHGPRYPIDWRYHQLRHPPYGYEWVRDNGQFVLIAIGSGIVADVLINR